MSDNYRGRGNTAKSRADSIFDTDAGAIRRAAPGADGKRSLRKFNRNRNNIRIVIYVALAAVVITAAVVLSLTVLFKIENITVDMGENVPYTPEEIIEQCDVKIGDNLFASPMGDAAAEITRRLPYIENCRITRTLPSTIVIHVGGAEILGAVAEGSEKYTVISTGGRVIDSVSGSDVPGYIRIEGINTSAADIGMPLPDSERRKADIALRIIKGMDEQGVAVQSVTFDEKGWVSAMYDGRVELVFGGSNGLDDKIRLAAALLSEGKITRNESGKLFLNVEGQATFSPDYLHR